MDPSSKVDGKDTFWLKESDWKVVSEVHSIPELITALRKAPQTVFLHHLANGRNDFAAWVEAVFKEEALAARLRQVQRTDPDAQKKICATLESGIPKTARQHKAKHA